MHQIKEEDELKMLQRVIPNITPETYKVYQTCMKTDAMYKSAYPYGITSALLTFVMVPKKLGIIRPIGSVIIGIVMSSLGKLLYAPVCYKRAFRSSNKLLESNEERKHISSFDEEQQSKFLEPTDHFMEKEKLWSDSDTPFESSYEFSNINDDFQEEVINEKQKNEKKHVTYDDLWTQHKEEEKQSQHKRINRFHSALDARQYWNQQKMAAEEPAVSEAGIDEKDIWS